jgi:hypothetical protein
MSEIHHYIEAGHFSERTRRMWERVGPADETLTLDISDYVELQGDLPNNGGPRSSLFRTPPRPIGNTDRTTDTALEVHIPAIDLGALALRRWSDFIGPNDTRHIGGEILRTLAHSDRSFWEIPTILRGAQMFPSTQPIAEGFLAVSAVPGRSYEDAKLSLVFYYNSSHAFLAHAQIDTWLSEVSRYLVRRGLADSLSAMVGEGQSLADLMRAGSDPLPVPRNTAHAESFEELIPESLIKKGSFHGRHPQIQFDRFISQVRVPIHPDVHPDFSALLNESKLVRELSHHGFAVSWVDGVIDGMPRPVSNGPESLADILPAWLDLKNASFGSPQAHPETYWGPYLHIVADNVETPQEKLDAASGTLLLLHRFKDYITGLERVRWTK